MKYLTMLLAFLVIPAPGLARDKTEKYRVYLGTGKNIYQTELDLKDGSMTKPTQAAELANPSFIAIHPNEKYLYSVSEVDNGSIVAYAIDGKTGNLKRLNDQPSGGAWPCHLVVDREGKAVLAANYKDGTCTSIPIKSNGSLDKPASVHRHKGKGILPNQEGPHAHSINLDQANMFAFCADLGIDKILVYRFDAAKGSLEPHIAANVDLAPGTGPRHFAFHPDGKHAYINGEMGMNVYVCEYEPKKGSLTKKQKISTIEKLPEKKGGSTAEVVVHPSGKFVYVSNRDPYNSIAIFSVNSKTGELTAVGQETRGIKTPRNFAIEPTGNYLLVANQRGDNVISFRINPDSGELTPTGHRIEVAGPACVRFVK